MIPIELKTTSSILAERRDYVLVFFDDSEALYVNKKLHPDVALNYAITEIDPFNINELNIMELSEEACENIKKRMLKLNSIYSECYLINQVIARIYHRQFKHDEAEKYSIIMQKIAPSDSKGYVLQGDIWAIKQKYDLAISLYKKALKVARKKEIEDIYKKVGGLYIMKNDYKKAYKYLIESVKIFEPKSKNNELFLLGLAAAGSGKKEEAFKFFEMAYFKTQESEKDMINQILFEMKKLEEK